MRWLKSFYILDFLTALYYYYFYFTFCSASLVSGFWQLYFLASLMIGWCCLRCEDIPSSYSEQIYPKWNDITAWFYINGRTCSTYCSRLFGNGISTEYSRIKTTKWQLPYIFRKREAIRTVIYFTLYAQIECWVYITRAVTINWKKNWYIATQSKNGTIAIRKWNIAIICKAPFVCV